MNTDIERLLVRCEAMLVAMQFASTEVEEYGEETGVCTCPVCPVCGKEQFLGHAPDCQLIILISDIRATLKETV